MSLSFEEFMKAGREWDKMEERLFGLFGFNPANSNHYGVIHLYNKEIGAHTKDEELLAIRAAFVAWREEILAIFREEGYCPEEKELGRMLTADPMFGTVTFLGVLLDVYGGAEAYRSAIQKYVRERPGQEKRERKRIR